MWSYDQTTGDLFKTDGERVAVGYSGSGLGKNAPAWQDRHDVGPIPRGRYSIGAPKDLTGGPHGPFVLPLTPAPSNQMWGRGGFLIHGDGLGDHAGSASHGCIILPRATRELVNASGDRQLDVT